MTNINTNNTVVKIGDVYPNEFNPKQIEEGSEQFEKTIRQVTKSLKRFGQVESLKVRELEDGKLELVNGYHRWVAMQRCGFKEVEVKNLGKLSFSEAVGLTAMYEEIKNPIDSVEMASLLQDLQKDMSAEEIAEITPYSSEEVEEQIAILDYDFGEEENEEGQDKKEQRITYAVAFSTKEKRDDFAEFVKIKTKEYEIPEEVLMEMLINSFSNYNPDGKIQTGSEEG